MGKIKSKKISSGKSRNVPLTQQIIDDDSVKPTGRVKARGRRAEQASVQILDDRTSKKILIGARKQQKELEEELEATEPRDEESTSKQHLGRGEDSDDDDMEGNDIPDTISHNDEDGERLMSDLKISEDDAAALEMFMARESVKKRTLGDFISDKIKEKELEIETHLTDICSVQFQKLDHRVTKLYDGVRQVMSKYRSGKVPKAFKIIPSLTNWEQVLHLTDPENWSAAGMYAATRLFASNLSEKMAQRFYNLILLPRVRDDIAEYKRLNFHLYQSLRKALFRPGAFFKGIVLPLVEGRDCTLREAVIIGSVLSKNSVPMVHSAAALLKMAEMEYSGATSVFMHILLSKKYALPFRVIDGLVGHLINFESDHRTMPVLWHQTLLVFIQNYGPDLSLSQKDALLSLIKTHNHWKITDVIRKELVKDNPKDGGDEEKMD